MLLYQIGNPVGIVPSFRFARCCKEKKNEKSGSGNSLINNKALFEKKILFYFGSGFE